MNDSSLLFTDQVCLVTGASRGIGREIALELGRREAKVAVHYRQGEEGARETANTIRGRRAEAETFQADVRDARAVEKMIEAVHDRFGRLDLIVHNVGVFELHTLRETSIDEWRDLMAINLHSAFYCVKFGLPVMLGQGGGHFIFIGSVKADSVRARHNAGAYGVAKTGVVLLAKTLAREEGPRGIRANVINPGAIEGGWATEARRDSLIEQVPLHRLGAPQDIAGAVVYLHSDLGGYCNGSIINVDGGLWI
ncbi:MAG: SDR family oxidoreductase [Candidatus Omnitrophica bacterium]|nr:SDR family oxidoreductase [Candidatus Omnitrophota bacterium]